MSQTQKLHRDWHHSPLAYMDRDIAVKVPAELREVPQWITWKAGAVGADGKFQKLPVGKDGTGDEWQRSHQWYSCDDAIAAAEKCGHSGVGIVLPVRLADGTHLVALDYDTVDLTPGVGNERLQEIKDSHKQFKSPYIEESPSGQGLRLFVRCANSVPQISASNPLGGKDELFCASGRWVTVTGRKLGGTGITEATSEIQSLAVLLSNRSKVKKARATKQKAAKEPKPAGFAVAPLSPLMHLVAKGWTGWPEQKICDGDGREAMMLAYAGYLRGTGHPQADIERLCIEANSKHYEDLLDHDVVLDRSRRFEVKSTDSEQQSESEGVTETRPAWVITLNSRFAVVRIGSSVLIFDEQTPVETPNGVSHGPGYLDIQAFRQIHSGLHTPSPSPESRAQPLANAWLAHPARRQYQGAVFSPGRKTPDHILNLWSGFGVQPFAGDVGPWLHVLENIAPEAITRTYVLNWLAHKVQNPGNVPGTILLVNGKKGSGKNSLFDPIVHIFGAYGRVFDDAEQIAGRFTGHLQTVAFAVLDEALFIGNGQQADRIKSRVTATSMTFEAKGRDPIQGVNHCAYISLSNHSHVWQATIDERRAVVVEASEKLVDAHKFWTTYHAWFDGDGPAALLHYLQNLDVSSFDPRVIPKGTALRQQIEQTALKDPAAAWWHTVLSEGAISYRNGVRTNLAENDETEVSKAKLRESFMESTPRAQAGDWMGAMRKLRGWVGDSGLKAVKRGTGTNRVSMVVLPSLSDLQKAFEDAVGVRITWVVNE